MSGMHFILHRNATIATRQGHTIEFKKGEPTYVPKECWPEIVAVGGQPEEEIPEPVRNENEPADADERKKKIFAAFEAIVTANKRDTFTATGVPKIEALTEHIGFRIDPKERDALWQELKGNQA